MEDVEQSVAVVADQLEEAAEGVLGRHGRSALVRFEAAQLAQLCVAPQLAEQGGGVRMLEHDSGDERVPCGPDRVVVASLVPALLQERNEALVGQRVQHELESVQVTGCVYLLPGEQPFLWDPCHEPLLRQAWRVSLL